MLAHAETTTTTTPCIGASNENTGAPLTSMKPGGCEADISATVRARIFTVTF